MLDFGVRMGIEESDMSDSLVLVQLEMFVL